jgi:hypothetical protein
MKAFMDMGKLFILKYLKELTIELTNAMLVKVLNNYNLIRKILGIFV